MSDTIKVYEVIKQEIFCKDNDPIAWIVLRWFSANGKDGEYRVILSSPLAFDMETVPFQEKKWAEQEYDYCLKMLKALMSGGIVSCANWSDIPDLM